jgi:hypothetical protein
MPRLLINKTLRTRRTADFKLYAKLLRDAILRAASSMSNPRSSRWLVKRERRTAAVSMHLGYREKHDMAQKLKGLYEGLAQDPALQNMFTPQNRYDLLTDTAKIADITVISRYLTPNFQPPQPNPMEMQAQSDKTKSDAAMLTAQSNATKNERLAAYEQGELQLEGLDRHLGAMEKDRDFKRRDLETAARVDVAHRQMLLKEWTRPEEAKVQSLSHRDHNLWTCKLCLTTSGDPAALMQLGCRGCSIPQRLFYPPPPPGSLANPGAPGPVPPGATWRYVRTPWAKMSLMLPMAFRDFR